MELTIHELTLIAEALDTLDELEGRPEAGELAERVRAERDGLVYDRLGASLR